MKTYTFTIENTNQLEELNLSLFKNEKNILVQIFCGKNIEEFKKTIYFIADKLSNCVCIGSTSDGEIDNHNVHTNHITISISTFEKTVLKAAFISTNNSYNNGFNLAKELISENTKLLILFTDGIYTIGEEFLKGVEDQNRDILIAGGMAGDNGEFKKTYVSCGKNILSNGAVGVSLNSDVLSVSNYYRFNWNTIGIEHTIDKVSDKRVYSISGMKPYDFYKKYLGEEVADSLPVLGIEYPLITNRNNLQIARSVVERHKDGSLSFAGRFEKGEKVKLSFGHVETILQNSMDSFSSIKESNIESFYIYSCMARRRFMPKSIHKEIEPFANKASTSGFFTYGEFYHNNGHNELLNQTLTAVVLSESKIIKENHKEIKQSNISNLKHLSTIKALTHLIEESSKDFIKQAQNLEKEKEYSQKLLHMQKSFIYQTVHETNSPLAVIMNAVELYKMEFGKNLYLSHIESAMTNLTNIYDDLSYLITQNQIKYNKEKINIVNFLEERINFFKSLALQVRLEFQLLYNDKNMYIDFNKTKLQRIIDNNLTNAIKYSLENNKIFVELIRKNDDCIFLIKTKSHQITDINKIFDEYYREDERENGFGIGLNLVKRICDEENIKIEITSNNEKTIFSYKFKLNNEGK